MSTINKTDLTNLIAERTGKTKVESKAFLNAFMDTISDQLVQGNEISLLGFAGFKTTTTKARQGRNPLNGKTIQIPAKKTVKVTVGKALKDAVNR